MGTMRERIRRVLEEECYVGPYTSDWAVDKVLQALTESTNEMDVAGVTHLRTNPSDASGTWEVMVRAIRAGS